MMYTLSMTSSGIYHKYHMAMLNKVFFYALSLMEIQDVHLRYFIITGSMVNYDISNTVVLEIP